MFFDSCSLQEVSMLRNLWALLCFLTYDSVVTMESKTKQLEVWKLANTHFTTVYTQTIEDKGYFVDNLLSYLPNCSLPGNEVIVDC